MNLPYCNALRINTAIYKGDRARPDDYDNFTLNKAYSYYTLKDYDSSGEIAVINDNDRLVMQAGVDFDFL